MDIIEMSFEADPIGILWGIFIGGVAICSVVIVVVVHISFSVAIFRTLPTYLLPENRFSWDQAFGFWQHSSVGSLW